MNDILAQIVATKRAEIDRDQVAMPETELRRRAADAPPARNFYAAVTAPEGALRVIAEVKKASPSAGVIRPDFDPVAIAKAYEANGAAAISCLTDVSYFQGSLSYLTAIRQAVGIPVLRKDFIVDEYQVWEARAAGADAILLIAECLTEPRLVDLLILASELHMTVLLEVHDLESLIQVRDHLQFPRPGNVLLGINNRDLRAMKTDPDHTLRLLPEVPDRGILVSESGIRTPADVARLRENGVHRILVGEHLMRQPDPGLALKELMA